MYARVNTIYGKQDRVDEGVSHLEELDRAAVSATAGNLGLTTLMDRESGVIVAVSYWDEPAHSWDATLTRARASAAEAAGGVLVVESYELTSREAPSVPPPGAVVRAGRIQVGPARLADAQALIDEVVLPRLRSGAGFCGAEFLVDRVAGAGLLLTAWVSEDDAAWGDAVLDQLQDEALARVGSKLPRTETYVLVGGEATRGS